MYLNTPNEKQNVIYKLFIIIIIVLDSFGHKHILLFHYNSFIGRIFSIEI